MSTKPAQELASPQDVSVNEVDVQAVFGWLNRGNVVLVDVRETDEFEREYISGSLLCPLSMFDADVFPKFSDKRVVMLCAVGKRSAAAAKQLAKVDYGDVVNMTGGMLAWKEAGFPTELGTP